MCGIVGVVLKEDKGFYKKQEDSLLQMLFADQLRGEDSTGLICVEKDTSFHIAKEASDAATFIPLYKASKLATFMWNQGKAYIGHNRKKTMGSISDETAHPFVVDKTLAMVHNGTLYSHNQLAPNCAVDSEALTIHLHKALQKGMEDGKKERDIFEEALGHVHGAYAVAMYDQTRNSIFLVRNKERPLGILETDDAWYFMSENLMGAWVLARNGYDYSKLKFHSVDEHELVTFNLDKNNLVRDQLSPKKVWSSQPQTTNKGTLTGGITTVGHSKKIGGHCSEKDFKRFRKDFLGKRITVVVDDLLEEGYPSERLEWHNADCIMMFAQLPNCEFMHTVNIPIKISDFGIKGSDEILGKKWVVDLESMVLTSSGAIAIEGSDAKPVVLTLADQKNNHEFRSQLCMLSYEELTALHEEVKFSTMQWKTRAVQAEIGWRDTCGSLEEAYKRAKNRNVILQQVKKGDMFFYQDIDGRIYYETAIAVH